MALNKVASRTSSMRADISTALTLGVTLVSPMIYVAMGGLHLKAREDRLDIGNFRNVEWGVGGSSLDWRVLKRRSTASKTTGELRTRSVSQPDLLANPTVYLGYMWDMTYGIGEGDIAKNRASGPQKIRNMFADRADDAQAAVNAGLARDIWAPDETNRAGGLGMFTPAATGTYAGYAMNATETYDGASHFYWNPTGLDFGSSLTLASNFLQLNARMISQMTFSEKAGGTGLRRTPDFGVMTSAVYNGRLRAFHEGKLSLQGLSGVEPSNANMFEAGFTNMIVEGVTFFWDDLYCYANTVTGQCGTTATGGEILYGFSTEIKVCTTNTKGEGLVTTRETGEDAEAWLAGKIGVIKTGIMTLKFLNPRYFQVLYH